MLECGSDCPTMSLLRSQAAENRLRVREAIAQYRAEEAEWRANHPEEARWFELIPGFELLKGLPRGLLFRLFKRSPNGLKYWLRQHTGMNQSKRIKGGKLTHKYAVNLAACNFFTSKLLVGLARQKLLPPSWLLPLF